MKAPIIPTVLALTMAASAARGVECPGALAGELTEGPVHAVAVHAGHLYVGSGATLVVFSLADPANPVRTSAMALRGVIHDITPSAGHLFVAADDAGVEILELVDPGAPVPLARLPVPGVLASRVSVSGDRAYVAAGRSVRILDVSAPAAPVELGAWINAYLYVHDVAVSGNFAFIAGSTFEPFRGLVVLDVSDPAAPVMVATRPTASAPGAIALSGSFAYLALPSYVAGGLVVVDVSNPLEPVTVDTAIPGQRVTDVAVESGRAYAATLGGLKVLDLSDPAHPVELGSLPTAVAYRVASGSTLAAVGGAADLGQPNKVEVADVSDPTIPESLWIYEAPEAVIGVARSGTSAFVAAGYDGMRVVDFSNPANPIQVARLDTPNAHAVLVDGGLAYIADGTAVGPGALRVADISNPTQPSELGSLALPGGPNRLAKFGSRVYVGTLDAGLRIVNVINPAVPVEIGSYDLGEQVQDLAAIGMTVALASYGGVTILDTTNPASPAVLANYGSTSAAATAALGTLLAVKLEGTGAIPPRLDLVDLADPGSPLVLGSRPFAGVNQDGALSMTASKVGFAGHSRGVTLLDVTDPTVPLEISRYDPPGRSNAIVVSNDLILAGNEDAGISILSTSAMSACWIFSDGFETGNASRWSSTMP